MNYSFRSRLLFIFIVDFDLSIFQFFHVEKGLFFCHMMPVVVIDINDFFVTIEIGCP